MKRKKLLYVGNALSHSGKTVTHIETLSGLLVNEGHEVIITSSQLNKVLRLTDMVRTFLKHRKEVDLVLIDTYSTSNFWYAVIIGRLCRKYKLPYVPILHGGNLPARFESAKTSCLRLFEGALVNVAPSGYLLNAFKKEGFNNVKYIPNTIEIENYPFKKRDKLAPRLLWVRAFADIYNPQLALDILERVQKKYPEAALTMVGPEKDGSLEKCRKLAQKRNLPVTFTGKLSKENWIHLSRDFDIFINTTNFDNTPVSIIEAMALGLPIVSTNVGGLPFLIKSGDDGVLCPPNGPEQFSQEIITLIENPVLAVAISQKARAKSEQFDWTAVKALWMEVLS